MSDQPERKQINFTIVPDEQPGEPRTYANFCSIAHTPFDFTLTFCEVMPLSEKAVREAAQYSEAVRLYEEGFEAWKRVLVAGQDCRNRRSTEAGLYAQRCKDFRDLDRHQEMVYELNVKYSKLAQDVRQRKNRTQRSANYTKPSRS